MSDTTEMQALIDKVKSKSNKLKWVIGLAGVLLLAPLTWMLAYAVLGAAMLMTSLAIAAAVGAFIIYQTPRFMMRLENQKINGIVEEATRNPIPTLRSEWMKDGEEIESLREEIRNGDAAVESAWQQVQSLKDDMTPEDMANFRGDYEAQQAEISAQYADLAELEKNHRKADVEIKRLSAVWESANAMSRASAMTKAASRMDAISAIKRDAAYKAVTTASATAKAAIRSRIEQRKIINTGLPGTINPVIGYQPGVTAMNPVYVENQQETIKVKS